MPTSPAGGGWKLAAVAGLLGLLIGALAMYAASGSFVRSYLLDHPEVLRDAAERLREREAAEALAPIRPALETPFHGAWAGAADGDVVLVEFFDYACGYCRQSNPDIDRLLREDRRLKVVWREYPVLGPDSERAAIASLAAAKAGRFRPFYQHLYGAGRPTEQAVTAASRSLGLGEAELNAEYRAELERNFRLANMIGATGTPTFVIGDRILQGAVGYRTLREAVEAARERG